MLEKILLKTASKTSKLRENVVRRYFLIKPANFKLKRTPQRGFTFTFKGEAVFDYAVSSQNVVTLLYIGDSSIMCYVLIIYKLALYKFC